MSNGKHLLVPVRVQALVIDTAVVERRATVKEGVQRRVANDGKWSPARLDYARLTNSLAAPGPTPFFGATREAGGRKTDQLVLDPNSSVLPENEDRGVYLHWVLPPGLRHAYKPNSLDFPALPDQWLVVRFCRRGAGEGPTCRAWFLDGGLLSDDGPSNLLVPVDGRYEARCAGKVVPLEDFDAADFAGDRSTITAVGNLHTGSPTFTANVAENRNVLSWHDDLADLREPRGTGRVPKNVALTYLLVGWYHDARQEPFASLPAQIKKEDSAETPDALDVLKALGWKVDGKAESAAELAERRCLFHGMVAHVNYWNPDTHKGTILGYPGAPGVEGTLTTDPPVFKVGVGNSAEDALVSLVSSEYSGDGDKATLWKALEAVIYRQPESLVGGWNAAPRDHAVHQNWFTAQEAGKVWTIRPRTDRAGTFPADPNAAAAQTTAEPTPEQIASLKWLNETQAAADAATRELSALQQDLYARWWTICQKTRHDPVFADVSAEEEDCKALAARIEKLRADRDDLLARLQERKAFAADLPAELKLESESAPRFWSPADPVVVVKNVGVPTKHQFPNPLPCRLPERVAVAAEVAVKDVPKKFDAPDAGVAQLAANVRRLASGRDEILKSVIVEASVVEQAVGDLVTRSLPTEPAPVTSAERWKKWTERLVKDLASDRKPEDLPRDAVKLTAANASDVHPRQVAELWVRQPWSPLFMDWKISWRPTKNAGADLGPVWLFDRYDFKPKEKESLPAVGSSVRGRSMLSPVDGRLFAEPLEMLRELLNPATDADKKKGRATPFPAAVAEILKRYEIVWDRTLSELEKAGMMGQSLSGFHQALLGRDVTLPRVAPDPARPWAEDELKFRDSVVEALLAASAEGGPVGERLAPPAAGKPALDFTLLRAGALQLEEFWLVDDFGQWADLLQGTSAGGSSGQVFNPRMRWHDDKFSVAMPPRVVQPARLDFRFSDASDLGADVSETEAALGPVCGWVFYNPLDRGLALCDRMGRLAGELVLVEERGRFLVRWEGAPGFDRLDAIRNEELREFARALEESTPTQRPRLRALLELIDGALERIRPAAARRDAALFGQPLALVSAQVRLELFGKAWTDPHRKGPNQRPTERRPDGTGDPALDALSVRVLLGCAHNVEDGLVGYYKAGDFERVKSDDFKRIVPAPTAKGLKASDYFADAERDAVRVGFGAPQRLTLLMDAWGSVQAATGLLPARSITLAHAELDKTLARMEASFRVGPVLLQEGRVALPTPVGERGGWHFRGPGAEDAPARVAPPDPGFFDDKPLVAAEGLLLLLTSEE
jgi:hypothetical protein